MYWDESPSSIKSSNFLHEKINDYSEQCVKTEAQGAQLEQAARASTSLFLEHRSFHLYALNTLFYSDIYQLLSESSESFFSKELDMLG
jgi:hypothetical protein